MTRALNIAHRGGRWLWPENTLFALREAAKAGFDGAEIDVQLTRDGQAVLFHDFALSPSLCRTRDGQWLAPGADGSFPLVHRLVTAELAAFDVGRTRPDTEYGRMHAPETPRDGERIPLLRDAIAAVKGINPAFRLFIEIKTAYQDRSLSASPEAVAEAVLADVDALDFAENTVLVGFDWPALLHARTLRPRIPCWFTTQLRAPVEGPESWAGGFDPANFASLPAAIAAAGGQGWLCSLFEATLPAVATARDHGLKFGVWTVNSEPEIRAISELNIDAIITDRPDRLAAIAGNPSLRKIANK